MNRQEAMASLGEQLQLDAMPTSITGLVEALGGPGRGGGTRAAAVLLGAPASPSTKEERTALSSAQRTLQRYMKAESGVRGNAARGTTAKAREGLLGKLQAGFQGTAAQKTYAKEQAQSQHAAGISVRVKGDFFLSHHQKGRAVRPVTIPADKLGPVIDQIQAGQLEKAAQAFDYAYGSSYDPSGMLDGMSWGESDSMADDAFDSLEIE